MKKHWNTEELIDRFTILPKELLWIEEKRLDNRLGFAILFKVFQREARFPAEPEEVPMSVVQFLAKQLKVPPSTWEHYSWKERTGTSHRSEIRRHFGFRDGSKRDEDEVIQWLLPQVWDYAQDEEALRSVVYTEYRRRQVEPPPDGQIGRLVRSAIRTQEKQFFDETYQTLSAVSTTRMDTLIDSWAEMEEIESNDASEAITFRKLTLGPGRASKESLLLEIRKLKTLRHLELPTDLLSHVPTKMLKRYRMRAVSEELRELRRHQPPVRYSLLAAFFWSRAQEITDSLVELLITIVHNIRIRSERKVERELLHEVKRVRGKRNLLVQLLEATLGHPDGIIEEVLYSVVDRQTLADLLKELKYTQAVYKEKVYVKMRSSYSQSYRRALSELLEILEFRSNNENHRPVLAALELVKQYIGTNQKYFPVTDEVPIEGVIRPMWQETVLETDPQGRPRVNRINYEICVFHALRDQLRCKEIWVVGADRYRNPEEDLPEDFETRRQEHYQALQQPMDADAFIAQLKEAQHAALSRLDQGLRRNKKVAITPHKGGWISVSPLEAQPEPAQLSRLKQEVSRRW